MSISTKSQWRAKRNSTRRIVLNVRAALVEKFPKTFMPRGAEKQPLKSGIFKDMVALCPEYSPDLISLVLHDYTSGYLYLKNYTAGAPRIDLDGAQCGAVSEELARQALVRLERVEAERARRALPKAA